MDKDVLVKKIIEFKNNACCDHTQQKAYGIMREIENELTDYQYGVLNKYWRWRCSDRYLNDVFHLKVNMIIKEIDPTYKERSE